MIEEQKTRIKVLSQITTLDTAVIIFLTTISQFKKAPGEWDRLVLYLALLFLLTSITSCVISMYILAFNKDPEIKPNPGLGFGCFILGIFTGSIYSILALSM
jgi:hypothetical protein